MGFVRQQNETIMTSHCKKSLDIFAPHNILVSQAVVKTYIAQRQSFNTNVNFLESGKGVKQEFRHCDPHKEVSTVTSYP